MKKTTIALMLAAGFTAAAHARAPVCQVYGFAELQKFSDKEMKDKFKEFMDNLGKRDVSGAIITENNCADELKRIQRIQEAREASDKPATSKQASEVK